MSGKHWVSSAIAQKRAEDGQAGWSAIMRGEDGCQRCASKNELVATGKPRARRSCQAMPAANVAARLRAD